jgi:hypothetical protein
VPCNDILNDLVGPGDSSKRYIYVPPIQASNITFSNVSASSFSISCYKGSGTKRVYFIKKGNTGDAIPSDDTSYTASTVFGSGSEIDSSGWYCVYNGSGNLVTVNNLLPNTTYRVMICEYNGTPGKELYKKSTSINNPANQATEIGKPTIQASNIIFSNITSTSVNYSFTRGTGSACIVLLTNSATTNPPLVDKTTYAYNSQIGSSGWYCKLNGTFSSDILTGLSPASYRIMVCEYNGNPGYEKYNTDTAVNNPNSFTIVGINDPMTVKIKIYPNPTNGQLVIENAKDFKLNILNLIGQVVYTQFIQTENFIIDLKEKSDGIYLVKLEGKGILVNQRLILKR